VIGAQRRGAEIDADALPLRRLSVVAATISTSRKRRCRIRAFVLPESGSHRRPLSFATAWGAGSPNRKDVSGRRARLIGKTDSGKTRRAKSRRDGIIEGAGGS